MNIGIVSPEGAPARSGNLVTAARWQRILRSLGHTVSAGRGYAGKAFDLLIVLHAYRGAASAALWRQRFPERALIVALTGTDLYVDLPRRASARRSLEIADRVIVLQSAALDELSPAVRRKTSVVYQSVTPESAPVRRAATGYFEVAVVGGLRRVKDPLRAAYAARALPRDSHIRVTCVGPSLDPRYEAAARAEEVRNPRFRWIGPVAHARARAIIGASSLLALTSRSEGGANVVAEALVAGTPVVSSEIAGSIGMLGASYPGYFPVADTRALADLMLRVERDTAFRERLIKAGAKRAKLFEPSAEREAWRHILGALTG